MTVWRFRKIEIMCFCCGQLSSLAISTNSQSTKNDFFHACIFFKGVFFVKMQAERRSLGPKIVKKKRLSQSTKIVSSRLIQTKRSLITLLFSFSRIKATLTTTYCTSPLLAKDIIKLGFYWNWLTSSAWYILVAPIKGLSSICTGLICPVAGRKLSWMFRTVWQKLSRLLH